MNKQIRQGDVFLEKIDKLPEDATKEKGKILAHGETTGHMHTVKTSKLFKGKSMLIGGADAIFVVVPEGGDTLTHQKHGHADLLPGVYEYTHQREMDYFAGVARNVLD